MKIFGVELELFKSVEPTIGESRYEPKEQLEHEYHTSRIPNLPPNPYKPMLQTRPYDIEPRRPIASKSAAGFVRRDQSIESFKKGLPVGKKREPISSVNLKWSNAYGNIEPRTTRKISFSENVTCHPIIRIQDLIAEFDEEEDTDDLIDGIYPDGPVDTIKKRKSVIFDDSESVTSLGPGCPTPDRNYSPISIPQVSSCKEQPKLSYQQFSQHPKDHLQELESLLNPQRYEMTPIISLSLTNMTHLARMPRDSDTTLQPQADVSKWQSLISRFKSLFYRRNGKVCPDA